MAVPSAQHIGDAVQRHIRQNAVLRGVGNSLSAYTSLSFSSSSAAELIPHDGCPQAEPHSFSRQR